MVASDYKLRQRSVDQSLSGRADLAVLVEVCVYAAVAAFLVLQLGRPPRRRRTTGLLLSVWVFGITLFLSAFYALYPLLALVRGIQLLVTCALCQSITKHARRYHLRLLVHAYLVLVAASVVVGAVYPLSRSVRGVTRFNWLYVHPVTAGTYLGMAVVLLVGILAQRGERPPPKWPRAAYVGLLTLTSLALLATRTRGAIIAAVLGSFTVMVFSCRRRARVDALVLGCVLSLFIAIVLGDQILAFLARGESVEQLSTLNARTGLWEEAFRLFAERPLTGYGLTASRGIFLDSSGLGGAHNAFVNVLTDAGLIGIGSFVCLLFLLVRHLLNQVRQRSPAWETPMLLGAVTFFMVDAMTTEGLGTPANISNIWLFVLAGWVGVLQRESESDRRPHRDRGDLTRPSLPQVGAVQVPLHAPSIVAVSPPEPTVPTRRRRSVWLRSISQRYRRTAK